MLLRLHTTEPFQISAGVAATMRSRYSRLDMQLLPSLAQSQSGANHSSSRSPMLLKFLFAVCEARRAAPVPKLSSSRESQGRAVYEVVKRHVSSQIVLPCSVLHADKFSPGVLSNDRKDRLDCITQIIRQH